MSKVSGNTEGNEPDTLLVSNQNSIIYLCDYKTSFVHNSTYADLSVVPGMPSQFLPGKEETILDTGIEHGKVQVMNTARKITVEVPEKLLERAQEASGEGITQTVRTGLRLVAASRTYALLRELRGKVKFSRTAADLKDDR